MTTLNDRCLPGAGSNAPIAAALAALGATAGIPLAIAQLDFAGIVDVFRIDADLPHAVTVLAGIGGFTTLCVVAATLAGAVLAALRSPAARPWLLACALAGFVTALMPWAPSALAIAGAACLCPDGDDRSEGGR